MLNLLSSAWKNLWNSPQQQNEEKNQQEIMVPHQEARPTTEGEQQEQQQEQQVTTQPFLDAEIDSELEVDTSSIPQPKFDISHEVMANDFPGSLSSLLWEAKIIERLYTKRLSAGDKDSAIIDQHQTDSCWTYYVQHYQGCNDKWYQWVNEDDILDTKEVPRPKFDLSKKVLARDVPYSLLLREAKIIRRLYSKCRSDDNDSATIGHQTGWCWSYFVHYQEWNHKWDQWCYEDEVFDDSIGSRILAKHLHVRGESTDEKKLYRSKKTPGKKTSLYGKNDAIVSNEQPGQTKRKIDDAAVRNKDPNSKRRTSSHVNAPSRKRSAAEYFSNPFADSSLRITSFVRSPEKGAEDRNARIRNFSAKREEALLTQEKTPVVASGVVTGSGIADKIRRSTSISLSDQSQVTTVDTATTATSTKAAIPVVENASVKLEKEIEKSDSAYNKAISSTVGATSNMNTSVAPAGPVHTNPKADQTATKEISTVQKPVDPQSDSSSLERLVQSAALSTLKLLVDNHFRCSICLDTFECPNVIPECLHRFCDTCIKNSIQRCGTQCPACRAHLTSRRDLRKDQLLEDIVSEKRWGCCLTISCNAVGLCTREIFFCIVLTLLHFFNQMDKVHSTINLLECASSIQVKVEEGTEVVLVR